MIRGNSRDRLTEADVEFITDTLSRGAHDKTALTNLLVDPESRDEILDSELLLRTILQNKGVSRISPYLYFYVLTRHTLRENKIDDREMSDYVSNLLAEFCSIRRMHAISKTQTKQYRYLVDIMNDAVDAASYEAFLLRSHLGNYALFLSGVFPDYVFTRSTYGRKAPGFEYYEQMGTTSYRWAANHRLALEYSVAEILANLAVSFRKVRKALNQLADNYISLSYRPDNLDSILRRIFFGPSNNPDT